MNYRPLGKTGLMVSEIGLGCEWLERHNTEECIRVISAAEEMGINILDCWMSEPNVRSNIGLAIAAHREKWIIQGHIGSTWQDGQYEKSRDPEKIRIAFEDLLHRLGTDYIDLGMIHFCDKDADFDELTGGPYMDYVRELKAAGKIRHIGMSTHNPVMARRAVEAGLVEMLLFSINPAFDMLPASDNIEDYFAEKYDAAMDRIDPERSALYQLCEEKGVGLTVMKGYAGGRLFRAESSPFGVALTPIQCLHYALTRPAVASVMVGVDDVAQLAQAVAYESASEKEKDYTIPLSQAPKHAYHGQCTYCGHCLPCPMEIDIAMVNKLADLALMQSTVPDSLREHYRNLEHTAEECVGCGGCEERCPFGVRVVEKMAKAKELFES